MCNNRMSNNRNNLLFSSIFYLTLGALIATAFIVVTSVIAIVSEQGM